MRIRTKLFLLSAGVGPVSLLLFSTITSWLANSTLDDIQGRALSALNAAQSESLAAIRDGLATTVAEEADAKRRLLSAFANDLAVGEAAEQLVAAFPRYTEQRGYDVEAVAAIRRGVEPYYTDQFAAKYAAETGGTPDTDGLIAKLSATGVALQQAFITSNPNPLGSKEALTSPDGDDSDYARVHARFHPMARDYLQTYGLYDVFLVDADTGDVVYSVFKELDYATNLRDGAWATSGLGATFEAALEAPPG
ncbi:MAG: hypothetical protein KDC98_16685, partial [Planctomycetes bacterium]|nr:hypothetical protein [Planctomycetota bacterium]